MGIYGKIDSSLKVCFVVIDETTDETKIHKAEAYTRLGTVPQLVMK